MCPPYCRLLCVSNQSVANGREVGLYGEKAELCYYMMVHVTSTKKANRSSSCKCNKPRVRMRTRKRSSSHNIPTPYQAHTSDSSIASCIIASFLRNFVFPQTVCLVARDSGGLQTSAFLVCSWRCTTQTEQADVYQSMTGEEGATVSRTAVRITAVSS